MAARPENENVGVEGVRPRTEVALVAALVFVSILALSLIVQDQRWEIAYGTGIAGGYILKGPAASTFLISGGPADPFVGLSTAEEGRLQLVSIITFGGPSWDVGPWGGGPMTFDSRWLYVGTWDGYLLVFPLTGFPDGYGNLSIVEHHGPVLLGEVLRRGITIRDIEISGNTLLVAGLLGDPGQEYVILGIDVSDPTRISEDPSSVRLLYNLTFPGYVNSVAVQDSMLYALESGTSPVDGTGTLHIFDVSATLPSPVDSHTLSAAQRFALEGTSLATISPWGNALTFYEVSNRTTIAFRNRFTLPGSPYRVQLHDGRAYVTWIQANPDAHVGISIYDPLAPAPVWAVALDRYRMSAVDDFAVDGNSVFMIGEIPGGSTTLTYASHPAVVVNPVFPVLLIATGAVAVLSYGFRRPRKPPADPRPEESALLRS